jgi:broad specificity phosphatase PhoE
VQKKVTGTTDVALNATGRAQASLLHDTLRGVSLDAVYCSTLSRSIETARVAVPTIPATRLADLAEQNQGRFQGGPNDTPEFLRRHADPDDALDGGESLNQLMARVRRALDRIRQEHPSGNVLIVAHSIANKMVLGVLLDLDVRTAFRIEQANDELYLVELQPALRPRVWKLIRDKNLNEL